MNILKIIDKIVFGILKIICIVTFTLVTILISTNVIMRFIPLFSTHIFDEILELVYSALIFYGAATLWITNDHFKFDMLINKIKNIKLKNSILIFTELMVLFFLGIFTYYSLNLTIRTHDFSLIF